MGMWEEAEKKAEEANQGGLFLRLQDDGDQAVVAFCGDPHPHEVVWTGEGYEAYDPDKHDKKPSLRIKLNVFNTGESAMQIWEISANVFKSVVKLKNKYGLDSKTFEITRNGKKGDTKTTYMILPEGEIDKDLAERIATEQLHDLTGDGKGKDSGSNGSGNRELLMEILKKLPKDSLNTFLAKMETKKVKDIPANKLLAALELAEALKRAPAGDSDDLDPFA